MLPHHLIEPHYLVLGGVALAAFTFWACVVVGDTRAFRGAQSTASGLPCDAPANVMMLERNTKVRGFYEDLVKPLLE